MCGICGLWDPRGVSGPDRELLTAMNAGLRHRGPDESGMAVVRECGLAMRRLAIIDLATGQQPIETSDGSLAIVFNGEIYNYRELRAELVRGGDDRFKTQGDVEVVLHLFKERGVSALASLKGMFAFAIHDRAARRLLLARDRFGEKPLFYSTRSDGRLAFSSELRSLVEAPWIERRVSDRALQLYFKYGFVPAPLTIYEGIFQLLPGHTLLHDGASTVVERYVACEPSAAQPFKDDEEAEEAVRTALLAAVRRQMVSDVPIGAFLSGGIDSSAIAAAMQQQSTRPVKTFTVRFEHAAYDESAIARQVASHLGTEHHEFFVADASFEEADLWRIVDHVGQPFADSSAIPTFHVSSLVRQHVKVCLSGDGGDEVFGGYPFFRWVLSVDRLAALAPRSVLGALGNGARRLSGYPGMRRIPRLRSAWRAAEAAARPQDERATWIYQLFDPEARRDLLAQPIDAADGVPAARGASRLRELMGFRMATVLPDDMLVKVDRMSMAASLEVRAPMLDPDLVAVSRRLDDRMLIHKGTGKYMLRRAIRKWLPEAVFSHPKSGFSIPLHAFQNERYVSLCRDLILRRDGFMAERFRRPALEALVARGLGQKRDDADSSVYRSSHQLWALLQVAAWAERFRPTS